MLHTMYFADEVRSFAEIDKGQSAKIRDNELALAHQLIDGLSNTEFEPERYADDYRQRVLELINDKVEGKEIVTAGPPVQRAQVIDLMEALKESLAKHAPAAADKKPPAKVTRRGEAKAEPAPARKAQAGRK